MYYEHFGLNYPPFKITPDPQLFYAGGNRGLVLEALVYAIENGEGIIKVVGEVGSGKTMLCRMLEQQLPKRIEIVYLANPRLPPEMILHAIALEMRLPITLQSNRLQVMHDLHLKLLEKHAHNQQVVIFIEEAQGMPVTTLEEIRLLSNLETSRHKLLQIVLFGQPELEDNLATPNIRQLKERITHSFYLTSLNRFNVEEYLNFRMRTVGYRGPPVFSKPAIRILTQVSKGLMRRINILADKSLLAAFAQNTHQVLPKQIRLAARDSGFSYPLFSTSHYLIFIGILLLSGFMLTLGLAPMAQPIREWIYQTAWVKPTMTTSTATTATSVINSPTSSLLQQRRQATEKWLTQANGQFYSIQLMQTTEDNFIGVEKWLKQLELQPLLPQLYISHDLAKGPAKWNLMYGEFESLDQANAAIATLPDLVRRNKPYVRKIASLKLKE